MTSSPANAMAELVAEAVDAAHGGWKAPEFWTSLASLAATVTAVAWPGVAVTVKAVVAGVGALVVAVYVMAAHATRAKVAGTAINNAPRPLPVPAAAAAPSPSAAAAPAPAPAAPAVTQSPAAPTG